MGVRGVKVSNTVSLFASPTPCHLRRWGLSDALAKWWMWDGSPDAIPSAPWTPPGLWEATRITTKNCASRLITTVSVRPFFVNADPFTASNSDWQGCALGHNNKGLGGYVDVGCLRYGFYPNNVPGAESDQGKFWAVYPDHCG